MDDTATQNPVNPVDPNAAVAGQQVATAADQPVVVTPATVQEPVAATVNEVPSEVPGPAPVETAPVTPDVTMETTSEMPAQPAPVAGVVGVAEEQVVENTTLPQ